MVFMTFALVGLAVGLGARYPRFGVDVNQVAGSYGGVAFMMQAILFVIVIIILLGWPSSRYLMRQIRGVPLTTIDQMLIAACVVSAVGASIIVWLTSMRAGVRALDRLRD
jgi:hypothetical protein